MGTHSLFPAPIGGNDVTFGKTMGRNVKPIHWNMQMKGVEGLKAFVFPYWDQFYF